MSRTRSCPAVPAPPTDADTIDTGMMKARYEPLKPGRLATDDSPELNTNRKNTLMAMLGMQRRRHPQACSAATATTRSRTSVTIPASLLLRRARVVLLGAHPLAGGPQEHVVEGGLAQREPLESHCRLRPAPGPARAACPAAAAK